MTLTDEWRVRLGLRTSEDTGLRFSEDTGLRFSEDTGLRFSEDTRMVKRKGLDNDNHN